MKYTLNGFSQQVALSFKKTVGEKDKQKVIKIDCTDLTILRWFVDFYPNMRKMSADGKEYAWLSHKKLQEDLPILDISKRSCVDRMQKLVQFEILEYKCLKEGGTFSLYRFGKNYKRLISSNTQGMQSNVYDNVNDSTQGMQSNVYPVCNQPTNKDISITYTSNKDIYNRDKREDNKREDINYQLIADMYNEICISFPKLRSFSEARKKAIKARIKSGFTLEDFKEIFTRAEQSTFLKGGNDRNWSATFDWMMKDANAAKILDGNYDNKANGAPKHSKKQAFDERNYSEGELDRILYDPVREFMEGEENEVYRN